MNSPQNRRAASEAALKVTAEHTDRHSITPRVHHARRRLPPYARKWIAARQSGLVPTGWLWVWRTWPDREPGPWSIVVPANEHPRKYDYSLCRGLAVYVSCSSSDIGNAVLFGLIQAARPAIGVMIVDREFHTWI